MFSSFFRPCGISDVCDVYAYINDLDAPELCPPPSNRVLPLPSHYGILIYLSPSNNSACFTNYINDFTCKIGYSGSILLSEKWIPQ